MEMLSAASIALTRSGHSVGVAAAITGASSKYPVEKSDDFRVESLVHGVAVEPGGILPGFAYGICQCVGKAGNEGVMSGPFDEDVLRSRRQRLREPLRVIFHGRKVIALRAIDAGRHGKTRQRFVGEQRADRGEQYDRANATIVDLRNLAALSTGFPGSGTAKGTEPDLFGSSSAVLNKGIHARPDTGERKRGVAAGGMTHDGDAFALDIGAERLVFQHPVNHAGNLLWPPRPHPHRADTRQVAEVISRMHRRGNDIAARRQRRCELAVVQGAAPGTMRDDDQA